MNCEICRKPILEPRAVTRAEKAWMKELETVLLRAPPGIGLLTSGDAHLTVYDARDAKKHGIDHTYDGGAERHGLVLGELRSAVAIEGVSG